MTLHVVRRAAAHPAMRLVLLHGYGSDERDMFGLAQELPGEIDVICLRAPSETENGGYAWFDISVDENGFGMDLEGFQYATALVLQNLPDTSVPLVVGGFSQGAMIAAAVAAISEGVGAAWLMSGAFPPQLEVPATTGKPALVQHGQYDPVLPIEMGRDLAKRLEKAGMAVTLREYPVPHTVSADGLADGVEWLLSLGGKAA